MSNKLLEITSRFDSLAKQNEELTSQVTVSLNTAKVVQEAFKTKTNSKLVELEQYSRRKCFDFSGLPSSVP